MFINAHLRPVWDAFGSFVPPRSNYLQYKRQPVEMTRNGVSAWADFRDATSLASTPESQHTDDFAELENTSPSNAYHRYYQDTACVSQPEHFDYSRTVPYHTYQEQIHGNRRPSIIPVYDEQMVAGLYVFDGQANTLHTFQEWDRNVNKHENMPVNNGDNSGPHEYQPRSEPCLTSIPSSLPMAQPQPLLPRAAHSLLDESFQIPQPSPGTDYSDYAPLSVMSTDPILPNTYRLASTQDNLADTQWWTPPVQSNLNQYQLLDNTTLCDGLPRLNYATDRTGSSSSDDVSIPWAIRPPVPGHVSPDQTLLNGDYLYVPSSSLESSQGACHSANNSNSGDPRCSDQSQAVFASVTEPHHDKEIHRHPLPYSGAGDSMNVPTLRSSGTSKTRSGRSRSVECKSAKSSMTKSSHQTSWLPNVPRQKSTALQRIEPKLNENTENYSVADKKQSARALLRRGAKDEFLVKSKMAGMSYKEIRRQGKFTEAESTLRGRYRTLTKEKNARVRKPEWNDNDVKLLERATRKLVQNPGTPRARMPWKLVAEYIASHGGSYHFGNSTCRKKWDEIQGHSDS